MRDNGKSSTRVAVGAMLLGTALILSWLESLIPFFVGIPGMKLGLPNLAVVLFLYLDTWRTAAVCNILRIVLAGLLFGSLFGILFSLAGAFFSFVIMVSLKRIGHFGVTGVSIAGGVAHNLAQLAVAVFIVRTPGVWYYLPALLVSGAVTGALIGITAAAVLPYGGKWFQKGER